jgi:AraC-like DNA-binding protein
MMMHGSGQPKSGEARRDVVRPLHGFCTDCIAREDRLDAWNDRFGRLNSIAVAPAQRLSIAARNENWLLGQMLFSASSASTSRFRRDSQRVRRDGLDHWAIRVLRQGENRIRIGDDCHVVRPGEPILFSLDQTWDSEWADACWVSLCIPRDAYPELSAGLATLPPGRLRLPAAAFLTDYLLMLEMHLRRGASAGEPALAESTRAVVAACLLGDAQPMAMSPAQVCAAQFERVRGLIRQHLGSPRLDPGRLARMAEMSRSALYRLFAPHGGVTCYIQSQRLRLAHALLSDPALARQPVAALAERAGFFDASAFSRAFRAEFGYAPRDARAAAIGGRPLLASAAPRAMSEAPDFAALLLRIGATAPGRVSARAAPAPTP